MRVPVPPSLQSIVGNTHVRKALGTESKPEAERRKWKVVAEINAHLERLRRGEAQPKPSALFEGPRAWAEMIRRVREKGDHEAADTFEMLALDKGEEIEVKSGRDKAERWFQTATTTSKSLDELIVQWLEGASDLPLDDL